MFHSRGSATLGQVETPMPMPQCLNKARHLCYSRPVKILRKIDHDSRMSSDYRAVFQELSSGDGFEQIFFAGYSMGGNLVTKMAGEFAAAPPKALRGVGAVCPALDLAACADALERKENLLYERHFVSGLMDRYARKQKMFPDRYPLNGLVPIRTVRQSAAV